MGQKINPVSLRLQTTNRHFDNSWYSDYFYKKLITKDLFLEHYLNSFLKLVKLPAGRYSIQHLQKKTQVFNFLHYAKSTREWRSKLFGLTKRKSFSKKNRYFFKNSSNLNHFKTKWKKSKILNRFQKSKKRNSSKKLKLFYSTLNQQGVYKIQKKITSFQNFTLWSTLSLFGQKRTQKKLLFVNHNLNPILDQSTSNFIQDKGISSLNKSLIKQNQKVNFKNVSTRLCLEKGAQHLIWFHLMKLNGNEKGIVRKKIELNGNTKINFSDSSLLISNKEFDNSNLIFLQNLLVYKILKSHFKENKQLVKPQFSSLDYKYKNYLESSLSSLYKLELNLIPFKVKNDWQYASYLADEIVYFLEKRIPFRRLKSKILRQLSKISAIRGVRITCSGRVGGKSKKAQRAKTECIKYGQTSLHVFSSRIDFSCKTARTSFGSVGVKVWICYN